MLQKIIVLADDDSDDTEMFVEAVGIADENVLCHTAVNGEELLKTISALDRLPEIIFLDMNMPIMNGLHCLKALKADVRYAAVPVVMFSTSSYTKEVDLCLESGALGYLVKPADFNVLVTALKEVINNPGESLKDALHALKSSGCILFMR